MNPCKSHEPAYSYCSYASYLPQYGLVPAQYSPVYPQPLIPPTAQLPSGAQIPGFGPPPPMQIPSEESYIENILRYNRGKIATFYMTFENNQQWNAKIFRGRIETAGRDHIIISDPQSGKRYLLMMLNLDWVEFDEPITYIPPTVSPLLHFQESQ